MQQRLGSDFIAITRIFRFIINRGLPLIVVFTLQYFLNWLNFHTLVSWPAIIILVAAAYWLNFDLQRLVINANYHLPLFSSMLNKSIALSILASVVFYLDGQLQQRYIEIIQFCILIWIANSILTILLIEVAVLPLFKRKPKKIAIAAVTESSVAFAKGLFNQRFLAADFIGFFEDRVPDRIPDHSPYPILCRIDEISEFVSSQVVDHVLVSLPTQATYRFGFVLEQLLDSTASVHYLHDFLLFRPIREAMTPIGNMSVFTIIDAPSAGLEHLMKRSFDIVGALIGLLILSPIFILTAIFIKLDSKGPILFTQKRWGNKATPFNIYKFRSMTQATSEAAKVGENIQQTTKNDARVTKVGAFIRRTSIDELPQLLNILLGDMSIVGPRPHAVGHNQQYRLLVRGYMLRHKMKPGLTGWAQIHGFRGETDTIEKMEMRVQYDLEYLRNWTPILDIYVIFKTVWLVISGKNAY